MPQPPRRSPSRPDEQEASIARFWDDFNHRIDGIKAGLEVHVVAVVRHEMAPLAAKVDEVLDRVRRQDIREEERIKAEQRARENLEMGLAQAGRAIEVGAKREMAIDARIDGPHRRRTSRIVVIAGIVTAAITTGGGVWLSHIFNK